jgi:hypothetical protein
VSAGSVHHEPPSDPDTVVSGDSRGLYHLLIDGDVSALRVSGDRDAVARIVTAPAAPAAA